MLKNVEVTLFATAKKSSFEIEAADVFAEQEPRTAFVYLTLFSVQLSYTYGVR